MASILAVIPATSCSAERLFSGLLRLKAYLRNTMEQHRLDSVAMICIKRAYGNQVALLTISDNTMEGRTFSFNMF